MLEVTTLVKSAVLSLNLVTMWTTFLAVRIALDSMLSAALGLMKWTALMAVLRSACQVIL